MPKKSKSALRAEKAAARAEQEDQEDAEKQSLSPGMSPSRSTEDFSADRVVTSVLTSRATARDIKIDSFHMSLGGTELIQDCSIELTIVRRYGLIGRNGCGKSNFLECLAKREVEIPGHMQIYHLSEEAEPSELSALEAVIDFVKKELETLEALEESIMSEVGPEDERLELIYSLMEDLDPTTFETKAAELLHGLGFGRKMMAKATKDMSGGWRMRVALARALFVAPTLLLLDEPTNHLDLEACVWLESYLANYPRCLIVVSHSQDFLNGVCSHIIWMTQQKLSYYTGNYDTFRRTVQDEEIIQQKRYEKEQGDIAHIKQFISSCGTYSNLVKQAKSKQKIIDKMEAAGLAKPVYKEPKFELFFPDSVKLAPPVLPFVDVSFSYSGEKKDHLYEGLNLAVDCDSRIALVGPNGAGKSTLLKLMVGDLTPTAGTIPRNRQCIIGRYYQHSVEQLDNNATVLEFFMKTYPNTVNPPFQRDLEEWRAFVGRYGVSGKKQMAKIGTLSGGQKSRLVFAMIAMKNPSLLLLDEPTNHLDIDAIDGLADAINNYDGGLVLVSHDFRLIDQVAKTIWVCDHKKVEVWPGDIRSYKAHLAKKIKKNKI